MIDLDAMTRNTFEHQRRLLDEAGRRRLRAGASTSLDRHRSPGRAVRTQLAGVLRRTADRLEPAEPQPRIALLRAVAHRELTVDQALTLLDGCNGHRSAAS